MEAQLAHVHPPHGHLDRHPTPVEPIRPLPLDLDRRRRGHGKVDVASERRQPILELWWGEGVAVDRLALRVTRRRSGGEVDLRLVALVEADEARLEARRGAGEQEQEPGGERVERPGVPASRAVRVDRGHDVERRRPGRLVHEDDPAGPGSPRGGISGHVVVPICAPTSSR